MLKIPYVADTEQEVDDLPDDRFLSGYGGCKALIIYKFGILKKLWHGRYDVPVHFVITEYFTRKIPQNHPRGGTGAAQKPPDR